jgi:hypothetical protein
MRNWSRMSRTSSLSTTSYMLTILRLPISLNTPENVLTKGTALAPCGVPFAAAISLCTTTHLEYQLCCAADSAEPMRGTRQIEVPVVGAWAEKTQNAARIAPENIYP